MSGRTRTWVEIDLSRIAANVAVIRQRVGDGCGVVVPVKADGYGHGLRQVARAAITGGAWGLGVASLDEAAEIRSARVEVPVLILMPTLPEEAARVVQLGAHASITSEEQATALSAAAVAANTVARVHVEIDTGMRRAGLPDEGAVAVIQRIAKLPGLVVDGMFTHFSSADEASKKPTTRQSERFSGVVSALAETDFQPEHVHVANSAAAIRWGTGGGSLVRAGIAIYGATDEIAAVDDDLRSALRPALAWYARVVAVRELEPGDAVGYNRTYVARGHERIAVLGLGYGDGWPYGLSNRGHVLLRGRPAVIRGAVCMDLTMVDATPWPDLAVGEVATLIGGEGRQRRTVETVASEAGLISYAVLTGITARVPRIYTKGESA